MREGEATPKRIIVGPLCVKYVLIFGGWLLASFTTAARPIAFTLNERCHQCIALFLTDSAVLFPAQQATKRGSTAACSGLSSLPSQVTMSAQQGRERSTCIYVYAGTHQKSKPKSLTQHHAASVKVAPVRNQVSRNKRTMMNKPPLQAKPWSHPPVDIFHIVFRVGT